MSYPRNRNPNHLYRSFREETAAVLARQHESQQLRSDYSTLSSGGSIAVSATEGPRITTIHEAHESTLDLGAKNGVSIKLWYQEWGNPSGIPVLFVHGGPGQCVADYGNINEKFFESDRFRVIEVDQRGTGKSTPSVRDDFENMGHYLDISIQQMSADFEKVRSALNIDQWLVFGGSWGSTLGLDYAERYPERCLGLILRGIYLNTQAEFDAIYARKSFAGNERRLAEFDTFFDLGEKEKRLGKNEWSNVYNSQLDPNDSEEFIRMYEQMIVRGDRQAIWRFYVFENNIIEEDPAELVDPFTINEDDFAEAQSVAFFEARLFLRGTFEQPLQLLERVSSLKSAAAPVRTWIVQGTGDEVCPEIFAQQLVTALEEADVPHHAYFVNAGHKCSSDGMTVKLKECVDDFVAVHTGLVKCPVPTLSTGITTPAITLDVATKPNGSWVDLH